MFHSPSSPVIAVFLLASAIHSDGETPPSAAATVETARMTSLIADGKLSPPAPPPVLPDFRIKSTVVREMEVVESPPMSGLPPVTGTITTTVHLVANPKLPDPTPPVVGHQAFPAGRLAELSKHYRASRFVSVSAMVYDGARSRLRCYPNGHPEKEVTVWSNIDFRYFSGFSTFEVNGADGEFRKYHLFMMVHGEDMQKRAALMARLGRVFVPPVIPALPDGDPAFVVEGDSPDADSLKIVEDLHQLYRSEGVRMKAAYFARIKAQEEQRAYYLANPPVPKDVNVSFWRRDHPLKPSPSTDMQGGNP
jgi:hypothetical protein